MSSRLRRPFRRGRPPDKPAKKTSSASQDISDATILMLTQLKESADFFPPLKSAVAGVLGIYQIAQTISSNKKEANRISQRAVRVIEILEHATHASAGVSIELRNSINTFNGSLCYIKSVMENLSNQNRLERLLRLNGNKDELVLCNKLLDDAASEFTIASSTRVEVTVTKLENTIERKLDLTDFISSSERRLTAMEVHCSVFYHIVFF
ncbi:hypothetical protein BD410DRAFT_449128 [Rickenella mellea]|uniref:Mixed lineage kinase domain-containing protein n=1 Tax=Rickenella mellea TaxID=50990 RepID=A0A4Y7PWT1_9AGAM|nr:hypothetical protein BD410DRAFT_449128 [Rickenella mellea]